jgi:hypothetical protein
MPRVVVSVCVCVCLYVVCVVVCVHLFVLCVFGDVPLCLCACVELGAFVPLCLRLYVCGCIDGVCMSVCSRGHDH